MTTDRRPTVRVFHQSAGAVVLVTDRCLVLRRTGTDEWIFPKGHLERGELAVNAAVREVREETGLHVRILGMIGSTRYAFGRRNEHRKHVAWYLAERIGGEVVLEPIFSEHAFVSRADAQRVLTHASDREIADQAFALADKLKR
jgi:8-oxo-dGTP pyrophosphatase MutT (NUDIX family)